jgi:hypothetical protein
LKILAPRDVETALIDIDAFDGDIPALQEEIQNAKMQGT